MNRTRPSRRAPTCRCAVSTTSCSRPHVAAGTLAAAFRTEMRCALANIAWVRDGEEPLERVAGT
jgi:hypothetical protein